MSLDRRIEQAVTQATGEPARFRQSRSVGGGSINLTRVVILQDGRRLFIKTHPSSHRYPGMFAAEYRGLSLLDEPGVIRIPRPLACAEDFIVMEAFTATTPGPGWHEHMGRQLALLHCATRRESFGFDADNYLGTTPQPNEWMEHWVDFWRERRLGWQLQL